MALRPLAVILLLLIGWGCGRSAPLHEIVVGEDGVVRLPRAVVDDGGVHFFTYVHDGRNVNFLIRTDGNGTLHSHLDACYSCYRYKRGFVVETGQVVCIACRLVYDPADEYWDFIGACAPIPIRNVVDDDAVIIEVGRLEQASRYF